MSLLDGKVVTTVDTLMQKVEYNVGDTVELPCKYTVVPKEDQPLMVYWMKVWRLQHATQYTTYHTVLHVTNL